MTGSQPIDVFENLDDPAWLALFENLQTSWFRLETLQVYSVEYERAEFERFLRDGTFHRPPGDWQRMIARHLEARRTLQRVHVVEEPLTDYLQYELAAYQQNSDAGEDIRLIPTSHCRRPRNLPDGQDFWLFDDQDVWDMHYDADGRFIRALHSIAPDRLEECRRWRDAALNQAISLAEYLSRVAA